MEERKDGLSENEISKIIVDSCFKIHQKLGPGLFESVYEEILAHDLKAHHLNITRQQILPVVFEDIKMEIGFRTDIIVENKVIIEIKAIEELGKIHERQLLTYLRLTGLKLGLLLNFNVELMKNGIKRIVNNL